MLLKLLIIVGGLYFFYTQFMRKFQIPGADQSPKINDQADTDDEEYVDYEEVD